MTDQVSPERPDQIVSRLRDATGGMHAHCVNDSEKYRCARGNCACYERHVALLGEAADLIERLQRPGFVWVPREPTGAMLGLIAGEYDDGAKLTSDQALIVYRAMLAASAHHCLDCGADLSNYPASAAGHQCGPQTKDEGGGR